VEYFVGFGVVLLFDEAGVPLYSKVALLEEVFNYLVCGRQNASAAQLQPAALRALVPLPLHRLQYERLEGAVGVVHLVQPVLLLPPEVLSLVEPRTLPQHLLSDGPHLLIHSPPTRLQRHYKDQRICQNLRLIRRKEVEGLLYEPTMECDGVDIVRQVVVLLKVSKLLIRRCITIEQRSLVDEKLLILRYLFMFLHWFVISISHQDLQRRIWVNALHILRVFFIELADNIATLSCQHFYSFDLVRKQVVLCKFKLGVENASDRIPHWRIEDHS